MPTKVTQWKTEDGSVFATESEADAHELRHSFDAFIDDYVGRIPNAKSQAYSRRVLEEFIGELMESNEIDTLPRSKRIVGQIDQTVQRTPFAFEEFQSVSPRTDHGRFEEQNTN